MDPMRQRDPGTQRELQLRVEHPKTEPGQASLGGGVVGKVVGRQQGAKPFPFMETIFSKNKQFRSRATGELPAPPGHVRLGGGTTRIETGRWPGKSWGVQGGSKRGRLEAAKGRDNQGLSLTDPEPWILARVLLSPTLCLSLPRPFCCLTSSHPATEDLPYPATREDPFWPAGARAVGTWEDVPGWAPAGHEGRAGASGAAELVLVSHPACLLLSVLLYLSLILVSLHLSTCVSPRLSPLLSPCLSSSLSSLLCLATPGTHGH